MKKFEFLEHTGDLKFRAYGKSINELFENSALAVSSVFSRGNRIKDKIKREIEISAKDKESLLYKFIEELIYLFDADNFIISKTKVKIKDNNLKALIYGDDSNNYDDLDAVKSPTYAEMYIKEKDDTFECQVVIDV